MATLYKTPQPAGSAVPFSTKQFGVFQHEDPKNIDDANANLVDIAPDFYSAYKQMREHAADEAGQRPEWGQIDEKTSPKTYDILGHDGEVRISYEIATIRPSGRDVDGDSTWMREPDWLATEYVDRPDEHFGMYIDMDAQDKAKTTKHFLLGGFTNFGEASNAMKQSAHAYLADHAGARLLERSLELVGPNGDTRQRYQIVKGRWLYGEFVKEEAWLQKEAALCNEAGAYPSPNSSFGMPQGNKGILRMPREGSSPTPQPTCRAPVQAAPSPALVPAQVDPPQSRAPSKAATPVPEDIEMVEDDVEMAEAVAEAEDDDQDEVESWCTCQQPNDGHLMIGCENNDCPVQWYHGRCVGLTQAPKGVWFCPTCAPTHASAPKKRGRPKGGKDKLKAATGAGVSKSVGGGKGKGKGKGRV